MDETGCFETLASTAGASGIFRWWGVDSDQDCQLESDQTYYWNLIATSDDPGTDPDAIEPHLNCLDDSLCGGVYAPYQ